MDQRETIVQRIMKARVSAIIRTKDMGLAAEAMKAAVEGGFRMIEFTLTTPGALELIFEFSQRGDLLVGAGTVLTPVHAKEAVAAGARFLVSPVVDPDVIREAGRLGVAGMPGAFTPTEMQCARRAGADLVKVFPAPHGGIEFITSVLGPLPELRLFPTAGVTAENVIDYLEAGCAGCGFVRSLFRPEDLASRDFSAIRRRAAVIIETVRAWVASRADA